MAAFETEMATNFIGGPLYTLGGMVDEYRQKHEDAAAHDLDPKLLQMFYHTALSPPRGSLQLSDNEVANFTAQGRDCNREELDMLARRHTGMPCSASSTRADDDDDDDDDADAPNEGQASR